MKRILNPKNLRSRIEKRKIFEKIAPLREKFLRKNNYYYRDLERFYRFHIPSGQRVLELGCGKGDLLVAVQPSFGVGIDFCDFFIRQAKTKYSEYHFILADIEELPLKGKFDYIIISDVFESLDDIQNTLTQLHNCCHSGTRIICNFFNYLWEPILKLGEHLGIKTPSPLSHWLSIEDIENLFYLSGFEVICRGYRMLFPRKIPLISFFLNRIVSNLFFFRAFCLTQYLVARPQPVCDPDWKNKYSVSIVIPTRDEVGNIPGCFECTPKLGNWTELIFVDGNSTDGTVEAIKKGITEYGLEWKRVLLIPQRDRLGKSDAVRKGFAQAQGDILMILDSDLTVSPEELSKFYEVIATGRAEFVNGCRLVYEMEYQSMQLINYFGNKMFSIIFTWLLGQRIKDTLCGTKVLWRKDYEMIAQNLSYFGDFDPFGDFELLFGAAKLDRKIIDLPIHYRNRTYGKIKIKRWRHALLLLRMCLVALYRFKIQN